MSQNSLVIADGTGAQVLAAMNNALDTLRTQFAGPTPPGTPLPYQVWADTTTGILKVRDVANTTWIPVQPLSGLGYNVTKTLTGGTYTLTEFESLASSFEFNGALTSNLIIVVPNNMPVFAVENLTTGNFTLTIKTALGTGQAIGQGEISMVYCNGVNCEFISDTQGTTPQRPVISLLRTTALALTANVWNTIVFPIPSVQAVNGGMTQDPTTGGAVIPQTGLYRITGQATFTVSPALHVATAILLNRGIAWYGGAATTTAGWYSSPVVDYIAQLNAGTIVDLGVIPYGVTATLQAWGATYGPGASQLKVIRIA
ncbi:MAG: hypothetical protein ABL873_03800 [Gallionella sp.]